MGDHFHMMQLETLQTSANGAGLLVAMQTLPFDLSWHCLAEQRAHEWRLRQRPKRGYHLRLEEKIPI